MSIIYYASNQIVEYPNIIITKFPKDFSWGFYCTNNYAQAKRWALRRDGDSIINYFEYTENPELKILRFPEMNDQWLDFIALCRTGAVHQYDIVEGPMADDEIWNAVQGFVDGSFSRKAFWELAAFRYPTHQISFHTLSALKCIHFIRGENVDEN